MNKIAFHQNGQWTLEKSNYGPKGAKLYSIADNARRKASNTETIEHAGANRNVKNYGGFGGAKVAHIEDARIKRANKKQPVKTYSAEERAAYASAHPEKLKIAKNGQWDLDKSSYTPRANQYNYGPTFVDVTTGKKNKDKNPKPFSPEGKTSQAIKDPSSTKLTENGWTFG